MKIINTTEITDSILSLQKEQARQFIKGRDHLMALNALFDAAKAGEAGRDIARKLHAEDVVKIKNIMQYQTEKSQPTN